MAHRLPTTIQPGELRHRIQIVQPSGAQDAAGGVTPNPSLWTVLRTCWAQIETFTGATSFAAGEFTAVSTHWIVLRHPITFTPTAGMYVWWNTRTFFINAVLNPTEQTKMLIFVASEINDSTQLQPTPVAP